MIAAPAPRRLLIGKPHRPVRRTGRRRTARAACTASVLVDAVTGAKCSLPAKIVPANSRFQRSQIEHAYSAAMLMEMSAALAEWVSAPTLMKSTPASA